MALFFSIEFVGAASRQQWTPLCSQLSYDAIWLVRDSGLGKAGCQFLVWVLVVSSIVDGRRKVDDRTSCAGRGQEQRQLFFFSDYGTYKPRQPTHLKDGWDGIEKRKRGTRPSNLQNGAPSACDCNHCSAVVNHTSGRKRPGFVRQNRPCSKKGTREKWERGRPSLAPGFVLCLRGCTLQSGLHPFPIGLVDAVLQQTLDERCPLAMDTGRR